ncbi:MAG: L,D-transpeptidase family protein [Verrucomicrobiaceae bacterium]
MKHLTSFVLLACSILAQSIAHAEPLPDPLPKFPEPVESILRLQIFLDNQLFGPGKIDGRPGEFTTKALQRYQEANGLPQTELADHTLNLSAIGESYVTYTIREEDNKFVGDLPREPAQQSRKKYLPYSSLEEFLTERFHCAPEMLEFINKPMNLERLKVGDTVKVPNVKPFLIENLEQIAGLPEVPEFLSRVMKVNTLQKLLGVYDGDKLIASLPITPGSGYLATPPGTYHIIGIAQMPTFRWDKSVLEYGKRSDQSWELPVGPRNPVGVMWIGLNKPGIGVHGTNSPQTIGRSSSHGCMRTANWDVVRLSKQITKGMTVIIDGPKPDPRPAMQDTLAAQQPSAASSSSTKKAGFFKRLFGGR